MMQSKTKGLKFVLSIIIFFVLSGCLFLPVEEMELLKEYVFVEERDGGSCVDSLSILFTHAKIDTTEEGKLSIEIYGLYSRRVYYQGKLIYTHIDTASYWYDDVWNEVELLHFSEGCVCESDKEYVNEQLKMFGRLLDKKWLTVYYDLFSVKERKIKGLSGGCKGELSYYELVYVRDLTSE